jgi:hypothetical protein
MNKILVKLIVKNNYKVCENRCPVKISPIIISPTKYSVKNISVRNILDLIIIIIIIIIYYKCKIKLSHHYELLLSNMYYYSL